MIVVMLGSPGSGKGTQSSLLQEKYGLTHISTGNLLREEIAKKTPLGLELKKVLDDGGLAPDEVAVELVKKAFKDEDHGIILDGFPRTIRQAIELDKMLDAIGESITAVIDINLEDGAIIKRLSARRQCRGCGAIFNIAGDGDLKACAKCGGELYIRGDDTPEAVKHRIEIFKVEAVPLWYYYRGKPFYKRIDGGRSPGEVFAEITGFIDGRQKAGI
jgi:adenylate kinase